MGNSDSAGRRVDAHSLQIALQKALVLMTRMATNGHCERTWFLQPYWYVKPIKMLRLERLYSMETTATYDRDSQIKDVMMRETESLETWSNWLKSLWLGGSIRSVWNMVLRNLKQELHGVCDVDIRDVFLPLWSTLRRLAMLAELFDLNTEHDSVQAEIILSLVENSAAIRRQDGKQLNPSAAGQLVGEYLVREVREDAEDNNGAEEGLAVNMDKLKKKMSSKTFKSRALKNARGHFKCRCLEADGDKLWLHGQASHLTTEQRIGYVVAARVKYEESGLSQKVEKAKATERTLRSPDK